jgi:hypothetical protein
MGLHNFKTVQVFMFMSYSEHEETAASFPKLLGKFAIVLDLSWIPCPF